MVSVYRGRTGPEQPAAATDDDGRVPFLFAGYDQRTAAIIVARYGHHGRDGRRHFIIGATVGRTIVVEFGLERATLSVQTGAERVRQLLAPARRGRQVRAQVSGRIVRVGQHGVVAVMLLRYKKNDVIRTCRT